MASYADNKKRMSETRLFNSHYVGLSPETLKLLDTIARKKDKTITELILVALDNEFDCKNPFELELNISHLPYIDENSPESHRLFDFLRKYPGLSLEQLVLCRRDFKVESREAVLLAYRHLLKIDMIVEYEPRSRIRRPVGYRVAKIKPNPALEKREKKYRKIEPLKGPLDEL